MRHGIKPHRELGDMPALLIGLQHMDCDKELRSRLFALLEEHLAPLVRHDRGRPGMALWPILVMGVVMQGVNGDFDRLHDRVNEHKTLRKFLGHAAIWDRKQYSHPSVVDKVSLLPPEVLSAVGRLVVERGHTVAKKTACDVLSGRCDSLVVATDVHHPTDGNLLWDARRCLSRESGRAARECDLRGWRQKGTWTDTVRKRFHAVGKSRQATPQRVKAYRALCRPLVVRDCESIQID